MSCLKSKHLRLSELTQAIPKDLTLSDDTYPYHNRIKDLQERHKKALKQDNIAKPIHISFLEDFTISESMSFIYLNVLFI